MREHDLRGQLVARAQALGLDRAMTERAHLLQQVEETERRLAWAEGRISFWDRLNIFSDTEDESAAKSLRHELAGHQITLASTHKEAMRAIQALSEESPLFALGALVEQAGARALALTHPRQRAGAEAVLRHLQTRLIAHFVPSASLEELLASITEEVCQAAAAPAPLSADATLRYAPLDAPALLSIVARRLLDGGFFHQQAQLSALVSQLDAALSRYQSAADAVSIWDKLLFFHTSPAERQRDQEEEQHRAAARALQAAQEALQHTVQEALATFPPLEVYLRALELSALVGALTLVKERALLPSGEIITRQVLAPRPLLLVAQRRMIEAWRRAFPEVPLPSDFAPAPPPPEGPRAQLLAEAAQLFSEQLTEVRALALRYAGLAGGLSRASALARARVSVWDRLAFWSDSDAEQAARILDGRLAWNRFAAEQAWQDLLQHGQATCREIFAYRLRESIVAAGVAAQQLSTDVGSSSSPKSCPVYHKQEALAPLETLRLALETLYHVRDTFVGLMDAVAAAPPIEQIFGRDQRVGFRPLTHQQLVSGLAYALRETSFRERYAQARAASSSQEQTLAEKREVEATISFWDKLNFFTDTPEEQQRDELAQAAHAQQQEASALAGEAAQLLRGVLPLYPPMMLYLDTQEAIRAVGAVQAHSRSYTTTTGSGKQRRRVTRYRCELSGRGAARAAVRRCAARFVEHYGDLPGLHELLSAWPAFEPQAEVARHPYRG